MAVFLDWVLPDIPGIEACRSLRALDRLVPIIFVSGRDDEASTIRGLDAGADDYLAKPVRIRELIARLEAHIRKVGVLTERQAAEPSADQERMRRFGDVEVDLAARMVSVGGQPLNLAPLEFSLLEYLARNAGVAVSRDQIMREVYGFAADISTERVDQLVRRLRTKLGEGPHRGGVLVAVPGMATGWSRARRSPPDKIESAMAYVIVQPCIGLKDASCVEVCPVDCIHSDDASEMYFIDPDECIDCGPASIPARSTPSTPRTRCPSNGGTSSRSTPTTSRSSRGLTA